MSISFFEEPFMCIIPNKMLPLCNGQIHSVKTDHLNCSQMDVSREKKACPTRSILRQKETKPIQPIMVVYMLHFKCITSSGLNRFWQTCIQYKCQDLQSGTKIHDCHHQTVNQRWYFGNKDVVVSIKVLWHLQRENQRYIYFNVVAFGINNCF